MCWLCRMALGKVLNRVDEPCGEWTCELRNVLTVVPMEYKLKVRTYRLFGIGTGA